ncbi:MAG: DNA polymerase sliding clamp, partial [Methanoregulaceae archaeon]|nr:DNA polymerase sliding clamp [Methanoregulaceae archaeon]
MLKATIDADILKESIDAISALVTECRLHTDETGMSTRAVDTANVAMISLSLKKEAFESFESTKNELGMDIAKMKNIFGMMGKDDLIILELPDDGHKLKVSFEGYRYSITLLDPNTIRKDPNPPNIDLPGKVVLSGSELNNAIKAASVVSDKIALGIDP